MTLFLKIFCTSLFGLCIFLLWIAWPVKPRKVDTRKIDKEIDKLLDIEDYEIKTYHE